MLAELNDRQTFFLIALAIVGVILIAKWIIEALNARGERFTERFNTYKGIDPYESEGALITPAADTMPDMGIRRSPNIDGLGSAIVRDTPAFGGNNPVRPRPIKDNPQA